MYIFGNNSCSVNDECEYGYSLYFPCIKTFTRGENVCFDFYIVDNATKEEIDLREVDDITLNVSGRYNCNFGSFSYPENIQSLQYEKFTENIYNIDFSNIVNYVKLYIDIVDEKHNIIESHLYDENLFLDINIEGNVGYFLNGSEKHGILNLTGLDTTQYMFLGWNIDESDEECDFENLYDFLIKKNKLSFYITEDCTIRAVYQKRREYTIQMSNDNYNSSFFVEYMGENNMLQFGESIVVLEGHDVKISCIPSDVKPYKFVRWDDGYKNPYRIFNISGDNLICLLKAYCELGDNDIKYEDNIDANSLNNFKTIYPVIRDNIFIDNYYIDNIYINNCEIDILDNVPYVKIIENGYIQIINIDTIGNLKLSINNKGGNCFLILNKHDVIYPTIVENNEFLFEFDGGVMTLTGDNSYIFGINLSKEIIYEKGKCMLCFDSEDTLKFHPGELSVDGGVIVNGNPYGISPIKFAKVTNVAPLIINKDNSI